MLVAAERLGVEVEHVEHRTGGEQAIAERPQTFGPHRGASARTLPGLRQGANRFLDAELTGVVTKCSHCGATSWFTYDADEPLSRSLVEDGKLQDGTLADCARDQPASTPARR